jgi:hypothetical protein
MDHSYFTYLDLSYEVVYSWLKSTMLFMDSMVEFDQERPERNKFFSFSPWSNCLPCCIFQHGQIPPRETKIRIFFLLVPLVKLWMSILQQWGTFQHAQNISPFNERFVIKTSTQPGQQKNLG